MKFLTTLTWFLFPLFLLGNAPMDSIKYLSPQDSVFLTVDENNTKIIEHRLKENQTMYSLAKFYGLEVIELFYYNTSLEKMQEIPLGTIVRIPIPNKAIKRYRTKNFDERRHASIYYEVKKGDNLYHIAKRLFRMPIEDVQKQNNFEGNNIQPGQLLHMGWISTDGVSRDIRRVKPIPPEWQTSNLNGNAYLQAKGIKREHTQRGVAAWDRNAKNAKYSFALHSYAPINSILEVTNPMNGRTLYVKVAGRPSSQKYYGSNVKVVLSPKAARMLGARDPRFFVNIKYLK